MYDANLLSDLHKDAYGCRPGQLFFKTWDAASETEKQKIWDGLCRAVEEEIEAEKAADARAVESFWALVKRTIEMGAKTQETAIRWIVEGLDIGSQDDPDYICYNLGLPYDMAYLFK